MASRYNRLFSLPENLYTPGSPVLISAGALLNDSQTGKVLAQLKFKNIFPKQIQAVTVSIAAYDVLGKELEGVPEFQYLDLSAERDSEFGSKVPIPLPDKVTRSICVRCTAVVFAGGVWEAPQSAHWEPLPPQIKLSEKMGAELVSQYRRDTVSTANFMPQAQADIWRCTCGGTNRHGEKTCHACHIEMDSMLSALNKKTLEDNKGLYDADQLKKRKAEEEAAQKARIQRVKRNKKIAIIGTLCAVILVVCYLTVSVFIPAKKYQTAVTMMANKEYLNAAQLFETLGEYKDSAEQGERCKELGHKQVTYESAIALLEEGNYLKAEESFRSLGDYEDAEKQAENAESLHLEQLSAEEEKQNQEAYSAAMTLLENREYQAAAKAFDELGNYKDSADQARIARETECQIFYDEASLLEESGDIASAAIAFGKLGDYKDSRSRSFALWDKIAVRDTIAAAPSYTLGVRSDGTVAVTSNGHNDDLIEYAEAWSDITAISNDIVTAVLKGDGTVDVFGTAVGFNIYDGANIRDHWQDIVAIDVGKGYVVGLKSNGTVIAAGSSSCNEISEWSDIIAVSAGVDNIAGLKKDGTVVVAGDNFTGVCDATAWTDIIAISLDNSHIVGLKSDGTVVAEGSNHRGACNVSDWKNIVAICTGTFNTIGLRSDGTVVVTGKDEDGDCNVSGFRNIVSVSTITHNTVGLRADGSVIATHPDQPGLENMKDILVPKH